MSWVVRVLRPPELVTAVAEWDSADSTVFQTFGDKVMVDRSDIGSFSFNIWPDDPQRDDVQVNDLVQFVDDGTVIAGGVIGKIIEDVIDGDEEAGQVVQIIGRGPLAVLDRALIFPANGVGSFPVEETRLFNWTSPAYVIEPGSDWVAATEIAQQKDPTEYWQLPDGTFLPNNSPTSGEWPANTAYWISPGKADPGDPPLDEWQAVGYSYFIRDFTLADATLAQLYVTADAQAVVYIDGIEMVSTSLTNGNPTQIRTPDGPFQLSAGDHRIAVRQFNNLSAGDTGGPKVQNPGGFLLALLELDGFGVVTGTILVSDDNFVVLERPDGPPGMTVGQALKLAKDEATDRGCLTWLSVDFDEDEDSAGVDWVDTGDFGTKTGATSIMRFVLELVDDGYCQTRVDPATWTWQVFKGDGDGTVTSVVLEPAADASTGNLTGLRRETV